MLPLKSSTGVASVAVQVAAAANQAPQLVTIPGRPDVNEGT